MFLKMADAKFVQLIVIVIGGDTTDIGITIMITIRIRIRKEDNIVRDLTRLLGVWYTARTMGQQLRVRMKQKARLRRKKRLKERAKASA